MSAMWQRVLATMNHDHRDTTPPTLNAAGGSNQEQTKFFVSAPLSTIYQFLVSTVAFFCGYSSSAKNLITHYTRFHITPLIS
jgi:hypothetical protein